jgi:3-oxoacyl-[acyl-carrier-protein] synthase-3
MFGIRSIAGFVPIEGIDNYKQGFEFGKDAEFIDARIGATFLPKLPRSMETSDLVVEAVRALQLKSPELKLTDLDALFVVTQNPDGYGLPHCSAIAQEKLGLPSSVAAMDISLGCSGYVYGLYALTGFMKQTRLRNGVLVTADPYSKILNKDDYSTSLLFGDAATATWISADAPWSLGASLFGTDGTGADSLARVGDHLAMDGRRVMSFAKRTVHAQIEGVLEMERLNKEQIDLFVLHQGSAIVVDAISKQLDVPRERIPFEMLRTGNTVSSSIPLILQTKLADESFRRIIVSGFGVGFSAATALIRRNSDSH